MAKDHGHARTLRAALATSAMLKHRLGDLHGARDGFAAAVDEARDVADRAAVGEASHNLGQVLLYLGDVDGARRAFEEAHETARRIGEPFPEAGYYDGLLELAADRPREAAAAFLSTRIAGRFSENRSFSAMLLAQLVRALVQTGDVEDARAHAAEAWERAQGLGIVHALASAYGARGFIHEADGEIDAAEEAFHEAVRIHADGGGRHYVAQNLIFIASIAAQAESFEESARLLGAIERMCTETGLVPFPDLLRRRATAEASCKAALGDERYAALFGEGRALDWREAVAYAQRGRGERGRPSHGWASLTPMETSVVELVAQGMTNPQIAAKLFISPRTVQSHLRNVFPKVGVATRAELAAEAARRGAVSSS
jgi:DNA-binding CsgD family transcriptional regulator